MADASAFAVAGRSAHTSERAVSSMRKLFGNLGRFLQSEDGPTAVEYAVMLALILVACITIVTSLGGSISGTFSSVNSGMSST
jgi:pilus assembly protein Flp/PilA